MRDIEKLLEIARRKSVIDQTSSWYSGSETYLTELKHEIDEVIEEIPRNRACYLEDELGDVLWDYLNILLALERESGIDMGSVISRACRKYEERISGIENGQLWKDIKAQQKQALAEELSRS
ncbi:MazG nucleotide pyrophosphohydrolase domain-containing protein [Litoribrevibacter euphylliae]|uniref:MazG nucleotide pyrophosphohydrolase domain-containing protein n=1 Tax=Litoribrevibacter euphylliae TaxID=1834034 RepID=A0ABV7HLD1_9GAMM